MIDSSKSSHWYPAGYAPACASFEPALSMITAAASFCVESDELRPGRRYGLAESTFCTNGARRRFDAAVSLLGTRFAAAVSQTAASTMALAIWRLVPTSLGSSASAFL